MSKTRPEQRTNIQQFYAGSKILVTGGTGFLGIILLEKLLRSCPDLSTIYLIIRQKKSMDSETRLGNIFKNVIFEKLIAERPEICKKVVAIFGDCAEPNLGLQEADAQTLINKVNFVFHVAATVNFEEKLQRATFINVRATGDILDLCRRMKQLKFIVTVSTIYAYSNERFDLSETFYETPYKANQLVSLAENIPSETIEKLSSIILDKFPNTYIFTKSVSEDQIKESSDLPIALYRPAIIVSTYKEPISGWINNYYGPQGVSTAAMLGLLRSLHCDEDVGANIVPVDLCANALIAIPWDCRDKYLEVQKHNKTAVEDDKKQYEIPIYHFESNTYNQITWKRVRSLTQLYGVQIPSMQMVGMYFFHLRKNIVSHTIAVYFMHHLPALLIDCFLMLIGKQPMFRDMYKKIHRFSAMISYFCTKNFAFRSSRMIGLWDRMSPGDSELFFCDLRDLNWDTFYTAYIQGCRTYLVKDPMDTVPAGQKRLFRLQVYTGFGVALILILFSSLIYFFCCLLA